LRFGHSRFPVEVLDESAEGFAVLAEDPPEMVINEDGFLRAGEDWYEVRIANIALMNVTKGENPLASRKKSLYRIGLRRLRDIGDPDFKKSTYLWSLLRLRWFQLGPGQGMGKFFGLLLLVFVAGATVMTLLIWGGQKALEEAQQQIVGPNDEGFSIFRKDSGSSPRRSAERSPAHQKFHEVIRHAPGATVFLEPEIADVLRLTDEQREAIRKIVEEARQKIEILRQTSASEDYPGRNAQLERRVISESRENAIRTLTDRQRKFWRSLAGENG
jgi:hypothetical protein